MEAVQFIYKEIEIDFLPTKKESVMVNATHMAAIFGKQVGDFTRNENTQNFINEALKNENSRFLGIENKSDLIDAKQKSGTWMHRVLALKFAAWLDPAFELWVFSTIDKIILGHYKEHWDAHVWEETLLKEKEALTTKLLVQPTTEDFKKYLLAEDNIRKAKNIKRKAIANQYKMF